MLSLKKPCRASPSDPEPHATRSTGIFLVRGMVECRVVRDQKNGTNATSKRSPYGTKSSDRPPFPEPVRHSERLGHFERSGSHFTKRRFGTRRFSRYGVQLAGSRRRRRQDVAAPCAFGPLVASGRRLLPCPETARTTPRGLAPVSKSHETTRGARVGRLSSFESRRISTHSKRLRDSSVPEQPQPRPPHARAPAPCVEARAGPHPPRRAATNARAAAGRARSDLHG